MISAYIVIAALASAVYRLTYRLSRKRRLVIAFTVFAIGSAAFSTWIVRNIDDQPLPGDKPYDPSKK